MGLSGLHYEHNQILYIITFLHIKFKLHSNYVSLSLIIPNKYFIHKSTETIECNTLFLIPCYY